MPDEYFTVKTGIDAGIAPHVLRGRRFARPYLGVRSLAVDDSIEGRATAFLPRLPSRACYFGATAASLWGLPLPPRTPEATIHIGVAAGARRIDCEGVTPHHVTISGIALTVVRGLPVTTPARTWCDLAA